MYKVSFSNKDNSFHQDLKSRWKNIFQPITSKNRELEIVHQSTNPGTGSDRFIYVVVIHAFYTDSGYPDFRTVGFVLASIGFNIMHDACHGSYSGKSWINNMMGLSLNLLGGNAFIWKFKHNIIHHTYTNIDGLDDDIAKSPVMRQCESQKWVKAHRFQHIYVVVLYAVSSFAWVSMMDFKKYFKGKIHNTESAENGSYRTYHFLVEQNNVCRVLYLSYPFIM